MTQFTRRFLAPAAIIGAAALTPFAASAAGFQITEQSVTGLGRAFAGSAAVAEDASTVFYNPAGMSQLDEAEFVMGASIIALNADFDRQIAVDAIGQPLSGGEGGSVGKLGGVPILYYVDPINDKWSWGIGINAPFGLSTDYEP
ncbi:MAG TPA: outer membrane protein transport protein, partial [Gammaproteobacteria bacterium]|nr:outer membrane protein transport protein [Gammaproteobacteria bacterium]